MTESITTKGPVSFSWHKFLTECEVEDEEEEEIEEDELESSAMEAE